MTIELSISELSAPQLQFGGAETNSDPKAGLLAAGPFDLRFGSARKDVIHVGIIGPTEQIDATHRWLQRCSNLIPVLGGNNLLNRPFPGFQGAFHKKLVAPEGSCQSISFPENASPLERALLGEPFQAFQKVVALYAGALERLASRQQNRPDVVLMCLPDTVLKRVRSVERKTTAAERAVIKQLTRDQASDQLDLFSSLLEEVEQTEEDLLRRDLRLALKAKALYFRLPIQLVTDRLIIESAQSQDTATRA